MEKDSGKNSIDEYVKIVCPRAEELSVIVSNVRCEECGLAFSNESRLRMHVVKIHEHKNLMKTIKGDIRYHCPEITCVYALKSQRYFTTMKYLKQHYLKVHAAKKFPCARCDKSFSTEAASLAHLRVCGVQFICGCLGVFGSYEALITHGKRTGHSIDEKYKKTLARRPQAEKRAKLVRLVGSLRCPAKPISILPNRPNCSYQAAAMKITFDAACQTDELKRGTKRTQSPTKSCKRRESRQTQTSLSTKTKRARKTVETQTLPNAVNSSKSKEKQKISRKNAVGDEKSSYTKDLGLNDNFTSENLFPSSPLVMQHDVALQDLWEEEKTSLGTQTSPENFFLEALSDSVTQTDLVSFYPRGDRCPVNSTIAENSCCSYDPRNAMSPDQLLTIDDEFTDRFSSIETQTEIDRTSGEIFFSNNPTRTAEGNFALSSNNETQTTENFHNIEQLLYSNTCTQTCNDILPEDLGLSDIQTQTAWHELVEETTNSAETQTTFNGNSTISSCRSWLNIQISHTETQTDLFNIFDEFS